MVGHDGLGSGQMAVLGAEVGGYQRLDLRVGHRLQLLLSVADVLLVGLDGLLEPGLVEVRALLGGQGRQVGLILRGHGQGQVEAPAAAEGEQGDIEPVVVLHDPDAKLAHGGALRPVDCRRAVGVVGDAALGRLGEKLLVRVIDGRCRHARHRGHPRRACRSGCRRRVVLGQREGAAEERRAQCERGECLVHDRGGLSKSKGSKRFYPSKNTGKRGGRRVNSDAVATRRSAPEGRRGRCRRPARPSSPARSSRRSGRRLWRRPPSWPPRHRRACRRA